MLTTRVQEKEGKPTSQVIDGLFFLLHVYKGEIKGLVKFRYQTKVFITPVPLQDVPIIPFILFCFLERTELVT